MTKEPKKLKIERLVFSTNDSGTTVHSRAIKNRHLTTFTKINSSYHNPKIKTYDYKTYDYKDSKK